MTQVPPLFTYYDHVPAHDNANELKMLTLWRRHHKQFGFDPFVLREFHARKHPRFAQFLEAVRKLPSINPENYDLACYVRWMAVAQMAHELRLKRAVMMDYDTFLTPTVHDDLNILKVESPDRLAVLQNTTPCLVLGSATNFEQACIWFASTKAAAELKHTSDMVILEHVATTEPAAFNRFNAVKCYGEDGWKTAPAIHFSNASMIPAGKGPRCDWIPKLLLEHTGGYRV